MADAFGSSGHGQMPDLSVIPYDTNRDVVLRHADSIVLRDPKTNQLIPFAHSQDVEPTSPRGEECPTCRRPWHRSSSASNRNAGTDTEAEEPSFITHDYFSMLARSLPGSTQTSPPPSPRRRIAQPVRSRLRSALSSSPPPEAEFVGSTPAPPTAGNHISETAFAPQYFEKFFKIERELGRGGRGVVLLVKHMLDGVPLGQFACKRVPIGDDHTWLEKVLVEVQLLQNLSHQNLVSYRHVWLEDYQINAFSPSVPCAFILQQYCNGGDLHNYVCGSAQSTTTTQQLKERMRRRSRGETELPRKANEPKKLPFDEIYSFFKDIIAGLRFLHHNGFIHRDLKPSNCLLHTTGHETRVLVSDFGEVQYEFAARKSTGATGTISYCAPEVLTRLAPGGPFGNFTFKSDIFSLGMILHFLCFANLPYRCANVLHEDQEDVDKLRAEILAWEGFDDQRKLRPELPAELYAFLKRLLSLNPDQRPSAEEVNHGVSTGRLDAFPELRRRNSSAPEELTPGRRIQKLDTPARGNSPSQPGLGVDLSSNQQQQHHHHHNTRRAGLQSRSRSHERLKPSKLRDETAISDDNDGSQATNEFSNTSDSNDEPDDNELASSSIILRPKPISPTTPTSDTKSSPMSKSVTLTGSTHDSGGDGGSGSEHGPKTNQLLLPPPLNPLTTTRTTWSTFVNSINSFLNIQFTNHSQRALVLTVKLISVLQPCLDRRQIGEPKIMYTLLTLAVMEATVLRPYRMWMFLLGVAVHGIVLYGALVSGGLCRGGNSLGQLDGGSGGGGWREQAMGDRFGGGTMRPTPSFTDASWEMDNGCGWINEG